MRNQIDEEKIDWLKWNQSKDCKLCFGCIVLVDAHIKICTIWLIKIYSFSFGELAGGAENSPLVLVDAWPLQFVCPCRWPRLGNWWAREAQLTELSHISRWGKVDTFWAYLQNLLVFPLWTGWEDLNLLQFDWKCHSRRLCDLKICQLWPVKSSEIFFEWNL